MGGILAIAALVLEVIYWATTKDQTLPFIALVFVTLALVVPFGVGFYSSRRAG
jgi:hypothetical protein